jgi:4-hydroxy-tetrahydrodipicolinate reductase
MINILLCGCNGKMGQVITRLASNHEEYRIVAGYDINNKVNSTYPVFDKIEDCNIPVDVMIDFSNPLAYENVIKYSSDKKIPLVIATTGLSKVQEKMLAGLKVQVPVFFSANMSLGVNLLYELVKQCAKVLESSYDIEIIEKHHNQKIDAPSGTALAIANNLNSALSEKYRLVYDRHSRRKSRNKNEIGIHSVRGGTIVGEHSVIFSGNDEIIEINHIAMSKDIFGVGALKAAGFICGQQPGLYSMTDLICEE